MWAEVIGDPIAHSRSPAIHHFWLDAVGIDARYRATQVAAEDLAHFFGARRADTAWRGCNVAAPHKRAILPLLDRVSGGAERAGAVNCIVRQDEALIGFNTDLDGIGEAIVGAQFDKVALIGAGGAARAALAWLSGKGAGEIVVLARDPHKASRELEFEAVRPLEADALEGTTLIVNASPLGMRHAGPMPAALLAGLAGAAPGATAFDMVYEPLDTLFLQTARANGLVTVDGLAMLIGQARAAFRLLFGAEAPRGDAELRAALCEWWS